MTAVVLRPADEPDPPPVTGVVLDPVERPARPIIPAWMRNPHDLRSTSKYAILHTAHTAAFHGARLPLYWTQYAVRAPHGTARLIGSLWRWAVFSESHDARVAAKADPDKFTKLVEQRQAIVRARMFILGVGALGAAAAVWWTVTSTSWPVAVLAVMFLLLLLGIVGKTGRIIPSASTTEKDKKPTPDLILDALASLSISGLNRTKDGRGMARISGPISRAGDGWHARIILPGGVVAGEVIARREKLAGGLQRPIDCVWPEGNPAAHPGVLDLWVADRPLSASKQSPWPYLRAGQTSIFEPFTFGVDPRGRDVAVTLFDAHGLVGSMPGMGKTMLLRLLALAAVLDPTCQLYVYDLKGGGDFMMFAPVAESCYADSDDETMAHLRDDLRDLDEVELPRRYKTIRSLNASVCPDNKVTPQLAADSTVGLHPIVLVMDEVHRAFAHKKYGEQIREYVEDLIRRGRACGIIVLLATQRPDAASIPTGISSNVVLRWCLKVQTHIENDMVMGTGAHTAGIRATSFASADKGICYFSGEGRDPTIVRVSRVDAVQATEIVARAVESRKVAEVGNVEPADLDDSLLDRLALVWPSGKDRMWWADLAELLAKRWPEYGHWTGDAENRGAQLAKAVAAIPECKLPSIPIHRGKRNWKGCTLPALRIAIAEDSQRKAGNPAGWPLLFDAAEAEQRIRPDGELR